MTNAPETPPPSEHEAARPAAVWPPFVRAAIGLALLGGFGLGGGLGLALALRLPLGTWWLAAVQAHGHLQLFGWAGLMVLGVGLHFMPRLRGAALVAPGLTRPALALLAAGLLARLVAQPALAATAEPLAVVLRSALAVAAVAELAGALVAVGLLAATLRRGPPLAARAGLRPVLPFFVVGFASLLLALAANLLGLLRVGPGGLVDPPLDGLLAQLGLDGFVVPIAVGMSMRTFPLYFRTHLPYQGPMHAGLALWVVGMLLSLAGWPHGLIGQAAAAALWLHALGVFAPREPRPRDTTPAWAPIPLHARAAYAWLGVAALLKLGEATARLGGPPVVPGADAERHALGAGFVTLLILGVGAEMLPGFARRPLRDPRLPWATLVLANAAAALRVGAALAPSLPPSLLGSLLGAAGLLGLAAVVAFALAVPSRPR
ncbi:MAG TPA: NnrS family protein [Chloroflexota bacterium]|nr:NnrS family protein [Chloroflexota bacterium]